MPLTIETMLERLREFQKSEPQPPARVSVSRAEAEQIRAEFQAVAGQDVSHVTHFAGIEIVVRED